jgi:flagellin
MSGVVLSSAVRTNLSTLQATATLQAQIQERLSTGKKVNSAIDNPSSFFTASGLGRRANELSSLLDGMAQGVKTLQAADNAMKSVTKSVESMQANIRQARSDKSFKSASYTLDTANAGTAAAKTLSISGGAVGATAVDIAAVVADVGGTRTSQVSTAYATPVAARQGSLTGNIDLSAGGNWAEQVDFTISLNGTSTETLNVSLANGSAINASLGTIQAAIAGSALNGKITATLDGANHLKLTTVNNVDSTITVVDNGDAGDADLLMDVVGNRTSVTGSDGAHAFTVNGTAVTITTSQTDITTAVAKANSDLGATHAFEAYDASGALGFRAKSNGATALTIANVAGSKAANNTAGGGIFNAAQTLGTATTTPGSAKTVDQMVEAINSHTSLVGKVKASNDGGKLKIENLSTEELTVVGATSTNLNGLTGLANTQKIGGNEVRKSLIGQFNDLRKQLDRTAADASYNGVNLLRADKLKITFNEVGTSSIEIQAKNTAGTVRGIGTEASSLNIGEGTAAEFVDDASLDARLDKLSNALTTLQTQSSEFGAALTTVQNRQDFTKAMIGTLQEGSDQLTLADANEEAAKLLALQTRQQLSQTALSLASQADQAVLRLF